MNLHEYQAKELLLKYGIHSPPFVIVEAKERFDEAFDKIGESSVVLKAQVHAGGRGKAGGVKLAEGKDQAKEMLSKLLGMKIITKQTGPLGIKVEKVLLSPKINYEKEYYLAVTIDRKNGKPALIVSKEGGMEIEEVAKESKNAVLKIDIPIDGNVKNYHLLEAANFLQLKGSLKVSFMTLARRVAKAFIELDASLIEINPLVSTQEGKMIALDAKMSIDDNANFRHPDIFHQFDRGQVSPLEVEANVHGLSYITLDGNIGCMVNGAGLAMATMDIIEFYGGAPANFLDVGGSATADKVAEGFKIILRDTRVHAILVNIFGGIMNCETIAEGIIKAAKQHPHMPPLIVRLEGTNVEGGRALLAKSSLKIDSVRTLSEAAQNAVQAVHHGHTRL